MSTFTNQLPERHIKTGAFVTIPGAYSSGGIYKYLAVITGVNKRTRTFSYRILIDIHCPDHSLWEQKEPYVSSFDLPDEKDTYRLHMRPMTKVAAKARLSEFRKAMARRLAIVRCEFLSLNDRYSSFSRLKKKLAA